MSCNCEGKTYNVSFGCCEPVLGPVQNYYTKYQIDKMIEEIESGITSGCCITPEEVESAITSAITYVEGEIPSLSGYATEQWVENQGYLTEHQHLKTINGESLVGDGNIVISGGTDLSNYYTTAETINLVESAVTVVEGEIPTVPTSNTAFTNDAGYLTEHQSLSGYVTNAEMSAFTYDKATIDEKVAQGGTFDPTQYYNKTATNALLDEKLDVTAYTPTDLSNYYNKQEVNNIVESAKTEVEAEIPSLSGYATEQWVLDKHYISGVDLSDYALKSEIPTVPTSNTAFTNDAGYLTEHQSLSGYATEQWVEDQHYITGVDLSNYATKAEIPVVPTSNTAFTNDAGYLTEHQQLKTINNQSITGTGNITIECECSGVTSGEVQTMIDQSVSGKVDTTTYNTYTASTQTTINSKADSSTLNNYLLKNKIWCGTESEYNSITTKDSETLYLIHE